MTQRRRSDCPEVTPPTDRLDGDLEVWGGVEATVNRVGDRYHDQLQRSGHIDRIDDLDLFATLGIRAIRYPVLWEQVAPNGLDSADWSWTDARLERLRILGIRPIAGLLHHGSGPKDTNLLDPAFPDRLAQYALAVAHRYPWLKDYTPVNEPLTTARFSALYGHWFPHERNDQSFARAIINQCKGTVLAMRAIRSVQPGARLIQSEDVGQTHSTEYMAYQASFENERRWISFDLLAGTLNEGNPMWDWLIYAGISPGDLQWFRDNPCPPDMLAINYYLTSERFLDEQLDLYQHEVPGTNGRDSYIDIAALHLLPEGIGGFRSVLTETWDRYHTPLCVGEAHLGSTVEEQLRWLNDAWTHGKDLRRTGVDVRAITIWALLGSFDWISLVTREENHYEPGPFDVRAPKPRPTALANMVRDLATVGRHDHPVLSIPGWWQRPQRLRFVSENAGSTNSMTTMADLVIDETPRQLLIVGADSPLRRELSEACERRFIPARPVDPVNIGDVMYAVRSPEVWSVIVTDTGLVEDSTKTDEIRSLHGLAKTVAEHCNARSLPLAVFSSHLVFDGLGHEPYTENQPLTPATLAGAALAKIEHATTGIHPQTLILRRGHLFGTNFFHNGARDADVISPTYLPDLANAAIDLLLDVEKGIWHLSNAGSVRWSDFRLAVEDALGIRLPGRQESVLTPKMRAITSERGWPMPDWRSALSRFAEHHRSQTNASLQVATGDD